MPLLLLVNRAFASLRYRGLRLANRSLLFLLQTGCREPIVTVRLLWRHLRIEATGLWHVPFASLCSSNPTPLDALRWHVPAAINGSRRHTLFAHPDSVVAWDVSTTGAALVTAWAALLPCVWENHQGPV